LIFDSVRAERVAHIEKVCLVIPQAFDMRCEENKDVIILIREWSGGAFLEQTPPPYMVRDALKSVGIIVTG